MERAKGAVSIIGKVNWRRMISFIRSSPLFASGILILVVIMGIFGPLIEPHDPTEGFLEDSLIPPFWQEGGTTKFLLGTDHMGRDMLSRIIGGARISLIVGVTVVLLAGSLGSVLALLSGYFGGRVDAIIMRLTDVMLSMPFLMVALVLTAVLGAGTKNIILVLAVLGWASYARVLRSEVLRVKQGDFVRLAITAGASHKKIMLRHIFPNIANTLLILATLQLASVIIAESSLSYLGFGVPPPNPAWGLMLADGRNYITYAWWLCVFPGVAIVLTVLGANLLGDWLRIRLDPKFRQI